MNCNMTYSLLYEGDKGVTAKKEEPGPTEEELRKAICEILTEVDLNKVCLYSLLFF